MPVWEGLRPPDPSAKVILAVGLAADAAHTLAHPAQARDADSPASLEEFARQLKAAAQSQTRGA